MEVTQPPEAWAGVSTQGTSPKARVHRSGAAQDPFAAVVLGSSEREVSSVPTAAGCGALAQSFLVHIAGPPELCLVRSGLGVPCTATGMFFLKTWVGSIHTVLFVSCVESKSRLSHLWQSC